MKAKSVYKIPEGKLIKVDLDFDEKTNKINNLNITGDFFAYPEESIEYIEKNLKDTYLDKDVLFKKINSIIKDNSIEFIGLNCEGIIVAIMMCLND